MIFHAHAIPVVRRCALSVAAILSLASCSTVNVRLKPGAVVDEGLAAAQTLGDLSGSAVVALGKGTSALLKTADHLDGRQGREAAAGYYLQAAIEARTALLSSPESMESKAHIALLTVHNDALARFAELWNEVSAQKGQPLNSVKIGDRAVEIEWNPASKYDSRYFDKLVAAKNVVNTKGVERKTRDGLGAALAGVRDQLPDRSEEMKFYAPRGLHVPVTMTLDEVRMKDGAASCVKLSLRNPVVEQTIDLGNKRYDLAADFSAPIALILAGRNEWMWGLGGFFNADERASAAGIFLVEPYDPNRIPVLLIHGLISVPIIWRDIVPTILADPELAKRYQIMIFTYPSSYPILESAALLRSELKEIRETYDPHHQQPLSNNMVVAGHSMGGILARTLATDFGDTIWKQFSDVPFDRVPLSSEERKRISSLVFFPPDPAVRRLIFYSVPHRGADMAKGGLVGLVSKTVDLPLDLLQATAVTAKPASPIDSSIYKIDIHRKQTSVQSLQPGAPAITALEISPFRQGVTYHSVIGDRGKGDSPKSSDGVVEYWSSHLDGAASELIVPTGHGSFAYPASIAEMKRILRLHAGLPAQASR